MVSVLQVMPCRWLVWNRPPVAVLAMRVYAKMRGAIRHGPQRTIRRLSFCLRFVEGKGAAAFIALAKVNLFRGG